MGKFVLYFTEIDKKSLPYVGGKGANLGEMTKAGFPIPQGFCVTTSAYQAFIEASDEMNRFFSQLDQIHADDLDEIRRLGLAIRNHLEHVPIPSDVQAAILEAWRRTGQEKAYAVRSSATAEDLPTASFAGQQETYLNVRGEEGLLDSVRRCWASLFTDRAIAYRAKNGFDHRHVFLSVVVQEMVNPLVSGILFTADPISGNRNVTSIDASFGLGEALVSGLVSADLYQVRSGQILHKKISDKKIAIYPVPDGGTVTRELPLDQQRAQALPDEKIIELANLGVKIKEHYGTDQDIEWCLADGKFYIVQSRPITTLYPVPKVADDRVHAFISVGHQQMMTDAMRPLGISVLRTFFPFKAPGSAASESPYVLEAGSRLFFDITNLLYLKPMKRILPRLLVNIDERIGSAIAELIHRPEFQLPADKRFRKTAVRIACYAAKNVLTGLLFRDPSRARECMDAFMKRSLEECEQFIFDVTGAERIRRVQESTGKLMVSILRVASRYFGSGLIAMVLVKALTRRWNGGDENVQLLNKSLPGNVTSELGLHIGDLADCARKYPEVVAYLGEAKDETFFEGLYQVPGGDEFAREFEKFLAKYGMRCPGEIDITTPRWREEPTRLVPSILSHIRTQKPGEHRQSFEQGRIEAEAAADRLIARVRKTRGGVFKAKLMARLINVYRNTVGMREYPKYTLIRHFDLYKRAILEEATRLVEHGVLRHESDVFYLSLGEILALENGTFDSDVQQVIADRKRQYEQNKRLAPPRVMTSEGEVITGTRRDVEAPEGALIGTPVSSGVAEGYAKVVLRPEEAKLNPGEIMIAPFTDPGWTPLFHSAKALVMEVGGMMTHGAVVAREYGIPAVVGIDGATKKIKDGDYIRVDGNKGYVLVLNKNLFDT
jgi:phosphoenolpyruvate synthase/pyruvate phosphate dikinase